MIIDVQGSATDRLAGHVREEFGRVIAQDFVQVKVEVHTTALLPVLGKHKDDLLLVLEDLPAKSVHVALLARLLCDELVWHHEAARPMPRLRPVDRALSFVHVLANKFDAVFRCVLAILILGVRVDDLELRVNPAREVLQFLDCQRLQPQQDFVQFSLSLEQ